METISIYAQVTGLHLRSISCREEFCDLQVQEGEAGFRGVGTPDAFFLAANGVLAALPPRPSHLHQFNRALLCWEVDLEQARALKWEEIKAARDAAEYGGFTAGGLVYDSDAVSVRRITGAVSLAMIAQGAGAPFSQEWTLADNSTTVLDAAGMIDVGLALGAHVAAAHGHAKQLRDSIAAAGTVEAVAALAW